MARCFPDEPQARHGISKRVWYRFSLLVTYMILQSTSMEITSKFICKYFFYFNVYFINFQNNFYCAKYLSLDFTGINFDNASSTFLSISNLTFSSSSIIISIMLAALAQMVACLPLVQQVRGSINLGARRGRDVHFLIARLYITVLD